MMGTFVTSHHEAELRRVIRSSSNLLRILRAARDVDPPGWIVGSGVIRDLVWDRAHRAADTLDVKDVDLAFFDPSDLTAEGEKLIEQQLRNRLDCPWEAKNQARVHLWYEKRFGFPVDPLISIEDAVETWPETAVCVGVSLLDDDDLHIVAPLGLEDLFGLVWRRNVRRVSGEESRRRLLRKRVSERWPRVTIVDEA
jgi:hypothetical protein